MSDDRNDGDGDKIFDIAGKVWSELKFGSVSSAVDKLKDISSKEFEMPEGVATALYGVSSKMRGKWEDVREMTDDLIDYAISRGGGMTEHIASRLDLPTRAEIEALEDRVRELEKENRKLKKELKEGSSAKSTPKKAAKKKSSTKKSSKKKAID